MIFGIDAGHEGVGSGLDCGAVGNNYYEANITLAVASSLKEKLLNYNNNNNVQVVMTRESSKANSLSEKTKILNSYNCDFVLSVHVNAGGGTGAEIYVYKKGTQSENIASKILNSYISKTGLKNRGIKEANYHMLRETKDKSALVELFFIDNKLDTDKMATEIDLMAQGLLEGFVEAFNLTPKNTTPSSTQANTEGVYRVIVGSYKDKANAEKQMELLKEKNIDTFIAYYSK